MRKLSLFNHDKRIRALEDEILSLREDPFLSILRTYGAICGFAAFVFILVAFTIPDIARLFGH